MNKKGWFLVLLLALSLVACNAATEAETTTAATTMEMPRATELLIGTWRLDGTPQDLTPEQAAQILPLWQLFNTMSQSNTAAPAELDAVVRQIEAAMTADQLAAIAAMDIQATSMRELMDEMGITSGQGVSPDGRTPPEGMVPGQGRGPGGGGDLTPEQMATAEAMRAERLNSASQRIPAPLLDAFLSYLTEKSQP